MNEFKFQIASVTLVALFAFSAYWSFTNISQGAYYRSSDIVTETESSVVLDKQDEGEEASIKTNTNTINQTNPSEELVKESVKTNTKHVELEEKLQKLVSDDIYMKRGSYGTRVGTVQEFLNLYFSTTKKVDNDYGPGTVEDIKKFQRAEALGADGQAGPATYKKMISLLAEL